MNAGVPATERVLQLDRRVHEGGYRSRKSGGCLESVVAASFILIDVKVTLILGESG